MKVGMRTPSIQKSISARTTGRAKRAVKGAVNPLYGKSGMGWVNNPKKAMYNKVYRKTTFPITGIWSMLGACIWYPIYWTILLSIWMLKWSFLLLWWIIAIPVKWILAAVRKDDSAAADNAALPSGTEGRGPEL